MKYWISVQSEEPRIFEVEETAPYNTLCAYYGKGNVHTTEAEARAALEKWEK